MYRPSRTKWALPPLRRWTHNLGMEYSKESVDPERLRGYLPTLDGWRAISIVLVLVRHTTFHVSSPLLQRGLNQFSLFGKVGVNIFSLSAAC